MGTDDTTQIRKEQTAELPRTVALRHTRRIVFGTVGTLLILAGLALIVFPGPWTIPFVLAGLTVLSWEFRWAKRLLFELRYRIKRFRARRKARA